MISIERQSGSTKLPDNNMGGHLKVTRTIVVAALSTRPEGFGNDATAQCTVSREWRQHWRPGAAVAGVSPRRNDRATPGRRASPTRDLARVSRYDSIANLTRHTRLLSHHHVVPGTTQALSMASHSSASKCSRNMSVTCGICTDMAAPGGVAAAQRYE